MKSKTTKRLKWLAIAVVLVGLVIWVDSRWNDWFYNPEEEPYEVSKVPTRVLLTFGDEGEKSRYVSWVCDTTVDSGASLLLVANEGDTISIPARGEIFHSRAGKATFYRAEIKCENLIPDCTYYYCVQTNGQRSKWYNFSVSNPDSQAFSFLYFGDVQDTINGIANKLIKEALRNHPDVEFVAFGGDLIERPMDSYYGETFRSIDSICTAMPVIDVTGNHDYLKGVIKKCERRFALTFPYFLKGMDERGDKNHLYSFHYHNTDFYLLDSDREPWNLFQQRLWLEEQLKKSSGTHKIVLIHHPLYSIKHENNNIIQRWMFNELLREANVELVLQGHEHGYSHCTADENPLKGNDCKNPPLYTISHCSPKNYSLHPTERFYPVFAEDRYYQVIRVDAKVITMLGYNANTGEMIDSVCIFQSKHLLDTP